MSNTVYPPLPHSNDNSITFCYLPQNIQSCVKDAYEVISRNEWWNELREVLLSRGVDHETGFMFNKDPFYIKIMDAVCSTDIGGRHSGASIGFVMREMEFIALHGEPAYRAMFQRKKQD